MSLSVPRVEPQVPCLCESVCFPVVSSLPCSLLTTISQVGREGGGVKSNVYEFIVSLTTRRGAESGNLPYTKLFVHKLEQLHTCV